MTGFAPCAAGLPSAPADPGRRVHHTHGLVLGVDELTQDFAYLAGRDRRALRDLAGYGTVSGLRVDVLPDDPAAPPRERGPRVVVSAGAAVTPSGRIVEVGAAQQASVNQWLDVHRVEVSRRAEIELGSPPSAWVELFLVLCWRERLTGTRPAPGGPCRTEDVSTVPSRVADDFALELRFDRPSQVEEGEVARFAALLPQIEFVESGGVTLDEFLDALRVAVASIGSPPGGVPTLMGGSPPGALRVHADDRREFLRAALRVWVTEVRPQVRGATGDDDCVLLAGVRVPVAFRDDGWRADDLASIAVDDAGRPLLVHTQLLQEWLLGASPAGAGGGGASGVAAAGRVRGAATLATRNGLRVLSPTAAGRVKLTFAGYRAPGGADDWVVKALPSRLPGAADPVVLDFGGFEDDGFVLLATRAGAALSADELSALELQVEVSRL